MNSPTTQQTYEQRMEEIRNEYNQRMNEIYDRHDRQMRTMITVYGLMAVVGTLMILFGH